MTIVSPMGQLRPVFADKNGKRLSGGKVFTYEPGTLTPKATYTDALGTIPNPNPINLDKSGEADIYLTGDCRVRVFDKHGVMIDDHDNLKLLPSKAYLDAILSGFASGASKFYLTLAQANADIANIAVNQPVNIGELENGGLWYKESANSIALTKTPYDTLDLARSYSDQKQVVQEEYIDELFEGKSQQIEQSLASQTQYVETAISQQGVSLQQLDSYYNYLMQRIASIAVNKGWDASLITDSSGKTQQEINDTYQNSSAFGAWFGLKPVEKVPNFDSTNFLLFAMQQSSLLKKELILQSGTYHINAAGIKSSLVGAILLENINGLIVKGQGQVTIKAVGSNDDFYSMFKILNSKNIEFHNIDFDGNGTKYFSSTNTNAFSNAYSAFYFRSDSDDAVDDILFYNCRFKNTGESAITSYGSSGTPLPHYFSNRVRFLFCEFENIGAHGIGMNEFRNSTVSICDFKNVGMKRLVGNIGSGYAIDVSGGCEDVTVSSCTVDGAGGGFKAETHTYSGGTVDQAAKNIVFLNNHIKNLHKNERYPGEDFAAQYPGYRINGIGCQIIGGSIEAYGHGVLVAGKAKNCSVSGVTISKTQAPNTDAIFFENGSDVYGDNSAQNNIIQKATRNGINLQGARNTASGNKISECGVGGLHINYARDAKAKNNECFNNTGYGIRVSKKTERASIVANDCYDTRAVGSKTQTTGIQVATVFDEASEIQVQANNVYGNAANDYSMSANNTYTLNQFGFKEVYAGSAPDGGLWRNGDRIIQSFYAAGRTKGWICSTNGGATRGILALSTAVSVGQWYQWSSGTTVWEVTIAGTTAAVAPDITGKSIGDTVVHGTATLTLRSITVAVFVSEGTY